MKLGDISPLAGMLTGEGLTGKAMASGVGGILPTAIARDAQKRKKEREGASMKKGGAVVRGQGLARPKKTKGC